MFSAKWFMFLFGESSSAATYTADRTGSHLICKVRLPRARSNTTVRDNMEPVGTVFESFHCSHVANSRSLSAEGRENRVILCFANPPEHQIDMVSSEFDKKMDCQASFARSEGGVDSDLPMHLLCLYPICHWSFLLNSLYLSNLLF